MNATQPLPGMLRRYLPILTWGAEYSRRTLANDQIVAAIVTVMLIPQLLAYALLANFLSHPVISGFITASGIQIAAGQAEGGAV